MLTLDIVNNFISNNLLPNIFVILNSVPALSLSYFILVDIYNLCKYIQWMNGRKFCVAISLLYSFFNDPFISVVAG